MLVPRARPISLIIVVLWLVACGPNDGATTDNSADGRPDSALAGHWVLSKTVSQGGTDGTVWSPRDGDRPTATAALVEDVVGGGVLELDGTAAGQAWMRLWAARAEMWPEEAVRTRPICLREPSTLSAAAERVRSLLGKPDGVIAVSLDREPSMSVRANPADWCLCDRCVALIRGALESDARGDVQAWNEASGQTYASWDEVRPWTTAQARAHVAEREPSAWRLAPWMLARAYQDATLAETVGALVEEVRRLAPDTPVGLTGLPPAAAFGGVDPLQLVARCSLFEPDPRGLDLPLFRDLAPPGARMLQSIETNDVASARWLAWRGVARGANGTVLRGDGPFEWTRDDIGAREQLDAVLDELARSTPFDEGVRIVVSHPSRSVRWLLDDKQTPIDDNGWPRRFGSVDVLTGGGALSRQAAWRALASRGRRFLDARQLTDPQALANVKLLVLADTLCLDDPEIAALRAFADNGGTVVADTAPGRFDSLGNGRDALPFEDDTRIRIDPSFAGLTALATDVLGPARVEVNATTNGGSDVPFELGLWTAKDGRLLMVAVPDWGVTWDHTSPSGVPPAEAQFGVTWTVRARRGDVLERDPLGAVLAPSTSRDDPTSTWQLTSLSAGFVLALRQR